MQAESGSRALTGTLNGISASASAPERPYPFQCFQLEIPMFHAKGFAARQALVIAKLSGSGPNAPVDTKLQPLHTVPPRPCTQPGSWCTRPESSYTRSKPRRTRSSSPCSDSAARTCTTSRAELQWDVTHVSLSHFSSGQTVTWQSRIFLPFNFFPFNFHNLSHGSRPYLCMTRVPYGDHAGSSLAPQSYGFRDFCSTPGSLA